MINTIEIASRRDENKMNTLYLDESGKAIGCTCSEAKAVHNAKYNLKPCRCMKQWNADTEQARKDADRTAYNYFCLSMDI